MSAGRGEPFPNAVEVAGAKPLVFGCPVAAVEGRGAMEMCLLSSDSC